MKCCVSKIGVNFVEAPSVFGSQLPCLGVEIHDQYVRII